MAQKGWELLILAVKRKDSIFGGRGMEKQRKGKQKNNQYIISFTVAECGEFHSMGEYHENIGTLDEAARIYRKIPPERMNGIPSIGIRLHMPGTEAVEDVQTDILSGSAIDTGIVRLMPELCDNTKVQGIIEEIIRMFPDKEVIDI